MANIPAQGNEIIVNAPGDRNASKIAPTNDLTSWVIGKVQAWEDYRNLGYSKDWKTYWRMWRSKWHSEDKNRQSERSRLIAPALAQAIEASVAEIEEAVFSQAVWFDIADDIADELWRQYDSSTDSSTVTDQRVEGGESLLEDGFDNPMRRNEL